MDFLPKKIRTSQRRSVKKRYIVLKATESGESNGRSPRSRRNRICPGGGPGGSNGGPG